MNDLAIIVLAAGKGVRMQSDLPKVMHKAAGRTLLGHVLTTAKTLGATRVVTVLSPGMDGAEAEARRHAPGGSIVFQDPPRGTADAVKAALPALDGFTGTIAVLFGADPLLKPDTVRALARSIEEGASLAVLGFTASDPAGYGRLIRDAAGHLIAIREQADATSEERKIRLCNSGVMAFDAASLRALLPKIGNANAKGEFYLTDMVCLTIDARRKVALTECPENEVWGVNSRAELAQVEAEFQRRLRERVMAEGATLVAPDTVFLSSDVRIGRDVVIEPHVVIGPGTSIGDDVLIKSFSHLEGASIATGAMVGPYARLRPGADIGEDAHIGNFVEIKNAKIGQGAKANHLTYIGDARVGERSNIGAGTITCNYDGFEKHMTDIGADVFVGSNTALVAPVKVGDGSNIGAGSVINRDVPAHALAVARGEQVVREGAATRYREMKRAKKAASKAGSGS